LFEQGLMTPQHMALDRSTTAGIAVPDALSIVGFDDSPAARWQHRH
jgi:DNA-binding LacI/PurR family transcriptional regulator